MLSMTTSTPFSPHHSPAWFAMSVHVTHVPPAGIFPISVALLHGFGVTSVSCVCTESSKMKVDWTLLTARI